MSKAMCVKFKNRKQPNLARRAAVFGEDESAYSNLLRKCPMGSMLRNAGEQVSLIDSGVVEGDLIGAKTRVARKCGTDRNTTVPKGVGLCAGYNKRNSITKHEGTVADDVGDKRLR